MRPSTGYSHSGPLVLRPLERFPFVLEDFASGFPIKVPLDFGLGAIDSTIPSPALLSECLQVWNSSLAQALS